MALAKDMDIPEKPKEAGEPWSVKRLFPLKATISSLTKSFSTPFDILLFFQVVIIGVSELIGREISWMFYVLTLVTLVADVIERHKFTPLKEETKAKKK